MKVVSITQRKGGVGKTSTAIFLSLAAAAAGQRVAVIDLDPQGTLATFWHLRGEDRQITSLTKPPAPGKLGALIESLRAGFDLVVVDTPPVADRTITEALQCSDLAVIPCRPSPLDLASASETVELAESLGIPFVFLPNAVRPRSRLSTQCVDVMASHGAVVPPEARFGLRDLYASALNDGSSPVEIEPGGEAAREITALWAFIAARLKKQRRNKPQHNTETLNG